ncbi:MAG: hypothetical protein OEO19_12390 [Gammaproteobacteria bacterium]|nr:hypothetical protein [Gammaproteobacteria bacterium]MDH3449841.1 hypothetical protein [Gammaproteobacteria bacterium]
MNTGDAFDFKRVYSVKFFPTILSIVIAKFFLFLGCLSTSIGYAAETSSKLNDLEIQKTEGPEIGIEIGALTLLGSDFRLFYRQADSPWIIGYRFLDIEDDFINEWVVGFPDDDSDREFTERSGPYVAYLFNAAGNESYYLSGALYRVETKIVCSLGEDSDAATSVYFGGGFQKKWSSNLGYNIGLLLSPTADLSIDANNCSSESEGDFDLNASLFFTF